MRMPRHGLDGGAPAHSLIRLHAHRMHTDARTGFVGSVHHTQESCAAYAQHNPPRRLENR